MKQLKLLLNTIRVQLLLNFITLVLLTAATIGLPALWLMSDQLNRQAWARVDQGSQAAWALYQARRDEMDDLATLTAERLTLHGLLARNALAELPAYLQTLPAGTGLDLLLVCDANRQPLSQIGGPLTANLCAANFPLGFQLITATDSVQPGLWLLAARPILTDDSKPLGTVVVGVQLDNEFAAQMYTQTGLEHTLVVYRHPAATSLAGGAITQVAARLEDTPPGLSLPTALPPAANARRTTFTLAGQPYYALRFSPNLAAQETLAAEVALPVADIAATRHRMVWTLLCGIGGVTALGSILGLWLTRRIRRPLTRLTEAATRLSQGDLSSLVPIDTNIREIARVAYALEAARLDLQLTLNDLRREKAWSRHLLESIVEGIVTLDSLKRITFFSQGAEHITGWSRDAVIGRSCDDIFKPADTDQPFSHNLPTLGRRSLIAVKLPDDRQATLSITGASLSPEGSPAQTALVFRDVSEEEIIHRLVGHFLANIAHEFRTPLSALAASVELLLDQAPDLTPAELQELLTSLHLGVLGLQNLIDNLLESASIEAGRFRVSPRPSNLADLITEVGRILQPLLDKRRQSLQVELPPTLPPVQADPRRTAQVLINLLSNASKYSPDETEITLGVTIADGWVRVTVADRGPGIPPEHHRDLFGRFLHDQAGRDDRLARGGTGLGLSVVKAVVEAQGGQVGVEERSGGGVIFWFTLPVVL